MENKYNAIVNYRTNRLTRKLGQLVVYDRMFYKYIYFVLS